MALSLESPVKPQPPAQDDFQERTNVAIKQIEARLDDLLADYRKLTNVVEDQVTEIKKAASQRDIHEASGKVMEECEKLNKTVNDRVTFIVTQTEEALVQTAATESTLEGHLKGAFAKAEANFSKMKDKMDDMEKQIETLKQKPMDTDAGDAKADAKETDLHMRAAMRRLERRVLKLESPREYPKDPPESKPESGGREPDVSFLFREFGNMKAELRDLRDSKRKDPDAPNDEKSGNCHCIHVDKLDISVSELEVEVDLLKKSHAATKEELRDLRSKGRAPLIPPRSQQGESHGGDDHGPREDSQPRAAPHGRWGNGAHEFRPQAPEFRPQGSGEPVSEDYPMWSYTDEIHYGKVFDDKIAMNTDYQFGSNGCEYGEKWRRQIRGYWIGKLPFLTAVLDWVEKHENVPVTSASLQDAATRMRWPDHVDYQKISGIIWGFLNMCLKGEAKSRFNQAATLNGLEGWRLIIGEIRRGRDVHLAKLRDQIRSPQHISKIADVNSGITRFENAIAEYIDAGGERPSDQEMKSDLLNVLPGEVSVHVMWQVTDPTQSYHMFSNHIRSQANSIVYHQGRRRGAPTNLVDDKEQAATDMEEEINAVYRRWNTPRPGGGPRQAPPRREDQKGSPPGPRPGNDRPTKCVNCGEEGHMARDCPKPQVAFKDRPCYICGKTGHLARDCRSRGGARQPARLVDDSTDVSFGGVVEYQESKPRPRPQLRTLDKFMPTKVQNAFEALAMQDEEGKPDEPVPPPPTPHPEPRRRRTQKSLSVVSPVCKHACCPSKSCSAPPQPAKESDGDDSDDDGPPELVSDADKTPVKSTKKSNEDTVRDFLDGKIPGLYDIIEEYNEESFEDFLAKAGKKFREDEAERIKLRDEHEAMLAEYAEDDEDDALLSAETDVPLEVALDSGCVAHVAEMKNIPAAVAIEKPANGKIKNFVGAGGDTIKNHGSAKVVLEQENGKQVTSTFQVADVCRALHSVSTICDNDHEVLFIKGSATVVPGGSLSRYLSEVKHLAAYPRRGGLYVGKMIAKNPQSASSSSGQDSNKSFGRQGGR